MSPIMTFIVVLNWSWSCLPGYKDEVELERLGWRQGIHDRLYTIRSQKMKEALLFDESVPLKGSYLYCKKKRHSIYNF